MPSQLHETLTELFRHRPPLAAELAECLGVKLPTYEQARLDSGDLTDLVPTQWRADAVVTLTNVDRQPVLAVVIEVQLRRDRDKHYSWPTYLTNLRARLQCPVLLLVICPDSRTAAWCAIRIELGPGFALNPFVLGPDQVPVVTDVNQASRSPELAVLSAMAHGAAPDQDRVFHALLVALDNVDYEHATLYAGVVFAALSDAARHRLEALMSTGTAEYRDYLSPFVNRFVNQGRREGEAKGEAKALLRVLAARGIDVPDDARTRITECTDLEQLDTWVSRAATARSVDDLFR